jgi:hypothetical protein
LTTIHMIGNRPNTAPSAAASSVCPKGIEYTARATMMATSSDSRAAHCALSFNPPSSTNSETSGSTAKTVDHPSESATGS